MRALFRAPRHPYTETLMASVPSMDAGVERLKYVDESRPTIVPVAWKACMRSLAMTPGATR